MPVAGNGESQWPLCSRICRATGAERHLRIEYVNIEHARPNRVASDGAQSATGSTNIVPPQTGQRA
jgi:hypothetical protein